jgi:hypothetical protein
MSIPQEDAETLALRTRKAVEAGRLEDALALTAQWVNTYKESDDFQRRLTHAYRQLTEQFARCAREHGQDVRATADNAFFMRAGNMNFQVTITQVPRP